MYGVRNTEAGQSYYDSLIEMYASWGVDFIKCDDICDSFSGRHESEMSVSYTHLDVYKRQEEKEKQRKKE